MSKPSISPLSEKIVRAYTAILTEELRPAMGCTEPIAIAYAASILRDALGNMPKSVKAAFSGNIIKNVKSVIVPMTDGRHGIEAAIAAGLISGRPDKSLEVLEVLPENSGDLIEKTVSECEISVSMLDTESAFDIYLYGVCDGRTATVRITDSHTNIAEVTLDGKALTDNYKKSMGCGNGFSTDTADRSLLEVEKIVEFANTADLSALAPLLHNQIKLNMDIAHEGLTGSWGASIGKLILSLGNDVSRRARAYAAAGSDARMSGCEKPVCIISGSGNQGITASVPVVVYAKELGVSEDKLLRALIVSDLITVHQKTGIGTLSAYCGAISAGVGAGAGICYLFGGGFREIAHTVVNAVAILSGTICDGAKPSCAAKIAMSVEAGILGFEMWRRGSQFYGGDGIITKGVENTIRNIGKLAKDGMLETDRKIIDIMLTDSE